MTDERAPSVPVAAFGALALWYGVVGFGGGFAVAQRIRRAVVDKKAWISESSFLEHFAVAGALPGTTATNLLTMLGLRLAGWRGAVVGAAGFLLPSVLLMIAFGAAYDRVRGIRSLASFLDGMGYATVGVVADVAVDMRRVAVESGAEALIGSLAALALVFRVLNLLEVVAIAGLVGVLAFRPPGPDPMPPVSSRLSSWMVGSVAASGSAALVVVFARIGVATFGGGFAMIPPIEHEVVAVRGWLSEAAFRDAMVLGQVTPGPVAIAATFIGYRVGGLLGSLSATLGMFGPPFVLSLLAARSLAAFRSSRQVQGFLRGVSPAVVGVIAAAAVALARTSLHSVFAAGVAAVTLTVLARVPSLSPLILLALGGALNLIAH